MYGMSTKDNNLLVEHVGECHVRAQPHEHQCTYSTVFP